MTTLRGKYGEVIGRITESGSILRIYDKYGAYRGMYDPKDNRTYDSYGRYYGEGNLLALLLA